VLSVVFAKENPAAEGVREKSGATSGKELPFLISGDGNSKKIRRRRESHYAKKRGRGAQTFSCRARVDT